MTTLSAKQSPLKNNSNVKWVIPDSCSVLDHITVSQGKTSEGMNTEKEKHTALCFKSSLYQLILTFLQDWT